MWAVRAAVGDMKRQVFGALGRYPFVTLLEWLGSA
jgi:hypothetical protein